jgi:hypothetical protein
MMLHTRRHFFSEVHYLIQYARILSENDEISQAELKTINSHLGALKSVLKPSFGSSMQSLGKKKTQPVHYPSMAQPNGRREETNIHLL